MARETLTSLKLTEKQAETLKELLDTYHGAKLITRLLRWLFVFVVLFVVDINKMIDGISRITTYVKSLAITNN